MKQQPKQLIKDIHLKNMGFVQYEGAIPREYYKEYDGIRLDACMGDDYDLEKKEGWDIVVFHDVKPNVMTIIKDLDLFIELNNLLNKIHETYKTSQN